LPSGVGQDRIQRSVIPPNRSKWARAASPSESAIAASKVAEHGIGALKGPWLQLVRSESERKLFARIRSALDPGGTLNPHVLPR
jgi:FAD/FMN-containing dehydrogenase